MSGFQWWHIHKWSDWAIGERGKVVDSIYTNNVVGSYIVQNRFCRTCGKHQIQQQRTGSIRSCVKLIADAKAPLRAPQRDKA